MKCDEVQPLQDSYLDSELDARTTLEIERHLKSCPECARLFGEQEELEDRIKAGVSQGQKTVALWEQIERSVVAAASCGARPQAAPCLSRPRSWHPLLSALGEHLQATWERSPSAWAGLAVAWLAILVLNLAAREREPQLVAGKQLPLAAEVRFAVKQKRLLLAELAFLSEPAPADKAKPVPPGPRSDRLKEPVNT